MITNFRVFRFRSTAGGTNSGRFKAGISLVLILFSIPFFGGRSTEFRWEYADFRSAGRCSAIFL